MLYNHKHKDMQVPDTVIVLRCYYLCSGILQTNQLNMMNHTCTTSTSKDIHTIE